MPDAPVILTRSIHAGRKLFGGFGGSLKPVVIVIPMPTEPQPKPRGWFD